MGDHYSPSSSSTYSLNSPVLDAPLRSSRRASSIPTSTPTLRDLRRRTATANSTSQLVPPVPVAVLGSPDPAFAVPAQRRSVQFANPGSQVNWARPLNNAPSSSGPSSFRPTMRIPSGPRPGSTSSNSDDDLPLTPLQAYLPPGAAPADRWPTPTGEKSDKSIGLGVTGITFEDSDSGYSFSPPTTPTRLQFVSESLDALSFPNTLEELTRLRKAAAELDLESKKLRRHKGRDPGSVRLLPRKAVPIATEEELSLPPKPNRQAVRHSLFVAAPDELALQDLPPLPPRSFSPPRRPLYSMNKAAMSSIEFTRGTDAEVDELRMGRRFVSTGGTGSTSTMPTLTSLRGSEDLPRPVAATRASPTAPGPPVLSPAPVPEPVQVAPAVRVPDLHSVKHKPSSSFLGKHKKLSRFLGKTAA